MVLVFASMIVAGLSVVQGRTIESQRNVIHILFADSRELTSIKMHDQQKRAAAANNQGDQQKSAPKSDCADSNKAGKGCSVPQATAPSQPAQDKNRTPEKSDDDNSIPNPQRLLHSI